MLRGSWLWLPEGSGSMPGERDRLCEIWMYPRQKTAGFLELLSLSHPHPIDTDVNTILGI